MAGKGESVNVGDSFSRTAMVFGSSATITSEARDYFSDTAHRVYRMLSLVLPCQDYQRQQPQWHHAQQSGDPGVSEYTVRVFVTSDLGKRSFDGGVGTGAGSRMEHVEFC